MHHAQIDNHRGVDTSNLLAASLVNWSSLSILNDARFGAPARCVQRIGTPPFPPRLN
ncbi:hypothetical protein RSSM_02911 [Rhodopirellula sallentina SM41]|uniref:Uncharacterized protein n=1 Tax=Rhodopirellula sallentina SM41 TaxID=1263870 RepID=M5UCN9_9BACT|nr:hypothetical protein RSSM_02911 [Rhodopirellula sallentina SM41]